MRKVWLMIGVGVLLFAASVTTLAQEGVVSGRFQAFAVDVTHTEPLTVSIPVTLEDGSVVTATAPLTVTIDLRVRVEGPNDATVETTGAGEVEVSVTELAAEGQELSDNFGYPYSVESPDNIEVVQIQSVEGYDETLKLIGEIQNVGDADLSEYTKVIVTLYADDGTMLSTDTGYLELDGVPPGGSSPFSVLTDALTADVASYKAQVSE